MLCDLDHKSNNCLIRCTSIFFVFSDPRSMISLTLSLLATHLRLSGRYAPIKQTWRETGEGGGFDLDFFVFFLGLWRDGGVRERRVYGRKKVSKERAKFGSENVWMVPPINEFGHCCMFVIRYLGSKIKSLSFFFFCSFFFHACSGFLL